MADSRAAGAIPATVVAQTAGAGVAGTSPVAAPSSPGNTGLPSHSPARSAAPVPGRPADARPAAPPADKARRRTLFARNDRDLRLMMFAEGWRQRVETEAPFELLQAAKSGPYENPVVTVALRRDGSVESTTIDRSSGSAAIDDAVRRIVALLSPYAGFPPEVALDFDVIEIRRVWTFDTAVRLFFGGR